MSIILLLEDGGGADTTDKRRSALWAFTPMWKNRPVPDGTIDVKDRAHIWVYRAHVQSVGGTNPWFFNQVILRHRR